MRERTNTWKRMVRKYRSKPVLVDPRSTVRTQRSVTFCRPRRDKWAVACLLVPFSSAFVVVPLFILMNAFQAQQVGSDSAAFLVLIPMLFGGLMLLLSLWIVTERQAISQEFSSSTLTIQYGAFGLGSRVELDLEPLEAELAEIPDWSQVSLMNVSLKHRERMDEEVRLASCSSRTWLLPLWRTLEELMPERTCDQTLVEVKLPEGHTLSVSRYATWQNDRIYLFGLSVSTPEPHVMRFHRLSLDGGFFRLPASPRSITLTRHGQELEIFCESPGSILSRREERQVLSLSDIAGIQICSQRRLRHRKRCVYFEINLLGEAFDDHRISLLNLNGVSSGSSVMSVGPPENGGEEVRQLAESIGEFLDKPVWDHRREV